MVVPTNINVDTLRGRAFRGFVQFQDPTGGGALWYRMKERQTMQLRFQFDHTKHYTDDGTLVVDSAGISHTFSMTFKLTGDLFDQEEDWNSTPPNDEKSLSYWIYQNSIQSPVEIIFVTTFEMVGGRFVNMKFTLDPTTFQTSLSGTGGSPEMTVSGIVLSITEVNDDTTGDQ